jgi:regulator of sigma E protease
MVLAAVLFAALYAAVGRPMALPVVGDVVADSAAARAGLAAGDRITAIDDEVVERFEDIQRIIVAHPAQQLTLHITRDERSIDVPVTTEARDAGRGKRVGVLGIHGGKTLFEPVPLWRAIPAGIAQTWEVTTQTLAGVWEILTTRHGAEQLGGPLRIAQLSGEVAQLGLAPFVSFIAVLSVNLALLNLFPIPVLDGGHLLFFLAEVIRGRPLPPRAQEYGTRAGFALLIGLFVFATWNDLADNPLFRWVAGLIG